MLKNISKLKGVSKLDRNQQKEINGGMLFIGPPSLACQASIDCSINTDGRCTCRFGRCIKGSENHCR